MVWLPGVMNRRLECAHPHLDAVVGGERIGDEGRQQNVGLTEMFDDLRFHGSPTGVR